MAAFEAAREGGCGRVATTPQPLLFASRALTTSFNLLSTHSRAARGEPLGVRPVTQDMFGHSQRKVRACPHVRTERRALRLRANEGVEQGDARRARDRHVAPIVACVLDPNASARFAEDPADVVGDLREEVARVILAVHAVEDTAAVGVDEAAKKLSGAPVDDLLLPLREFDRSLVLRPWPVLREVSDPQLRVATDLDGTRWSFRTRTRLPGITACIDAAHSQ